MIKLYGNGFTKEDAYFALRERELLTLTIMLENKCNFKCPFCYTQTRRFDNELSTSELKEMILDAKELGTRSILIAGAGEPLLAYNFWEIVDYIQDHQMNVVVFSNLSLITKEIALKLYDKKISIVGKLNSFKKEVQEKVIGNISGAYEKMKNGLSNLIEVGYTELSPENETMLSLETSVLPYNVDEMLDFWIYCRENNIFPLVDTVLYEGSAKQSNYDEFLVDYDVLKAQIDKIQSYDRSLGLSWRIKLVRREDNKGVIVGEIAGDCHRIGTNLNVDSEGNVYDCFNMSQKTYGNIREKSLIQIWKEDKPHRNALEVHGLCQCRNLIDRDSIEEELKCVN